MCKLWHEGKTEEEILSINSLNAIFNLLEDINCLKEDLHAANDMLRKFKNDKSVTHKNT